MFECGESVDKHQSSPRGTSGCSMIFLFKLILIKVGFFVECGEGVNAQQLNLVGFLELFRLYQKISLSQKHYIKEHIKLKFTFIETHICYNKHFPSQKRSTKKSIVCLKRKTSHFAATIHFSTFESAN